MRLLVIHDKPRGEMGGMNAFIAVQNRLFAAAGWSCTEAICARAPLAGVEHLAPSGRKASARAAIEALQALVERCRPDAVLAHSVYYALAPGALRALGRIVPLVCVLHDVTPWCPRQTRLTRTGALCQRRQGWACVGSGCYRPGADGRPLSDAWGLWIRWRQARAARAVPQWVVPSSWLGELLQQHGVERRRIAVVPHFVEPVPPPAQAPQPGALLYAGRLVPEKGLADLLQALARLQALRWSLRIAGDGSERHALGRQAVALGIADRIDWLGRLGPAALDAEYGRAAVVAMPSRIPESFGLVGVEALLRERPVVGYASGGMSEWLADGVTGRVARWGDIGSLADAVADLLRRPEAAQAMGRRGRARVLRDYAPALHLQRMQQVFAAARAASAASSPQRAREVPR